MKERKLISSIDKWDEFCNLCLDPIILIQIFSNYCNSLKQTPKLGDFVATDLKGNVLDNPKETDFVFEVHHEIVGSPIEYDGEAYCDALKQYKKAEERVLFEGFILDKNGVVENEKLGICISTERFKNKTIEDLIKYDLTLTESGLNQIQ